MALKSVLKPDSSVMTGLAEAAAVYVIYQAALPNHADIRTAAAHNTDIEAARKRAAWKAAGLLSFVFLLTQDLNSFLIGGLALGGIDVMYKHANGVHPATGKLAAAGSAITTEGAMAGNEDAYPLPDYGHDDTGAGSEAMGY
jgi:hypothetical protein